MMRIEEKLVHGHEVVVLESDLLSLTVVPGKGADIVSYIHRPTGMEFLWESPSGMDLLMKPANEFRYIGGWFETFPNSWHTSTHNGVKHRSYGDAFQLPWEYRILRNDEDEIQVEFSFQSKEIPLLLNRVMSLKAGEAVVRISETVTNLGNETVDFTWGHHPNLSRPFLNENCVIELPYCETFDEFDNEGVWPFLTREPDSEDLSIIPVYGTSNEDRRIYLKNMAESWVTVRNKQTGLAFKLAWDGAVFTDLLIWRSFHTKWTDMFGDNQILCFFPKRSFLNIAEAAKNGEAITLAAGESISSWIEASVET